MSSPAPFTLCRIFRGERTYYYALFRDPETGKRTNKKSVEMLRKRLGIFETTPIKRRDEAIRICYKALDAGIIFSEETEQTLVSYLRDFYTWEISEYAKRRNLLDPGSISPDYLATRLNLLENHVFPRIHTNLLLSRVTLAELERLQLELVQEGAIRNTTINMAMTTILVALREAQRRGLVPSSVVLSIQGLAAQHKERGILSEQELSAFMQYAKEHSEKRIYLACLLALLTGMRAGELRGLCLEAIGEGMITISQAYADRAGLKVPKGKRTRMVPCPTFVCDELRSLALENPFSHTHTLVFWSKKHGAFVSSHYFSERFQQELVRSGVFDKKTLQERNITFHSLRHMANTLLRGTVDEHVLRMTIGHTSEQLSNLYTHLSQRGLESVQLAQQNMILPLLESKPS
ncbi:tyrosine-type recombinase/integrase [Sphaerochaeta sp. S2]|uniref:tyrosine-type recombinase/integrase n=1 Tax=Sphaerochaeta sp. S2 TaxID=2798868 RepID=UPI0018E9D1F7|nr:tyrosine-type recombinase/integrase [Sphaerochaeta sp. S2]MBJ2354803.1 tyrosine-type recombinase/integrase [Sphaerochaeta sp. S2]